MHIFVSFLIALVLFTGCSTKNESLSLDRLNKPIELKNSKGITLFVTEKKQGESKHWIRGSVYSRDNINHTKSTLREEGFKLTDYKASADYVLILDDASTKFDNFSKNFFNEHARYQDVTLYGTNTLTLKFVLTKPENVSSYDYKVKNNDQVSSYTDSVSWQRVGNPHSKKNFAILVEEEKENFPKAYQIITKKVLVQMDEEYVFDD